MTSVTMRRTPAIWVALASTVLCLGLPLVADLPGRVLPVRVLLAAALALLLVAAVGSRPLPTQQRLVTAALGLLLFTAMLVIRVITPTGVVLLSISVGCLWWQRRLWSRGAYG
jgi:hypothetical protein